MDERIRKWLVDILIAIEEIESFLLDSPKLFSQYQKNQMLKRAIERNLEIIGEAMNRIVTNDSSFLEKIKEARNIVGLRNQIIHAYDSISDENIWSILINHLPELKVEVNMLLK
jgi:uncharacterized protein with HEPN domain